MSRRYGKKHKKQDKTPQRKFDPSPLIGDVDLTRKDVKLLLVRMPDHLCKQFEDGSRGVVGRMRLNVTPDELKRKADSSKPEPLQQNIAEENEFVARPLDTSFQKLNQQSEGTIYIDKPMQLGPGDGKGSMPKRPGGIDMSTLNNKYELLLQPITTDMVVFSGNSNQETDEMKLEGTVEAQLHARPPMTDAFRKLNKWRTTQLNTAKGKISIMTETEVKGADQVSLRPNAMFQSLRDREERKRAKEESRRHLDVKDDVWKEHTQAAIFKAYEIQAYYTADELAATVGEPSNRLRPFISELCQYNKAGPFSQRYELKDEFKTVTQRQLKERDLEQHRQAQLEIQRKRKEEREREREREKAEGVKKKARLN